jgi:hypothetical protein
LGFWIWHPPATPRRATTPTMTQIVTADPPPSSSSKDAYQDCF